MTLVVSQTKKNPILKMAHEKEENNNLVCEETSDSWITDDDDNEILRKDINFDSIPMTMMDSIIIISLIEKENDFKPGNDYLNRLLSKDSEFLLRNEAINWIWKACAHHNFGPLCIYLSVNYLDRFLTSSELPKDKKWAVQLLAVSCLSLAAKMEETYVPQCVDLQVENPKFVFEAKTIKRMELLVLNTLNWRMQVVTPFSFIDYFAGKIKDRFSENCNYRSSSQLILNTTKEVEFLEFKPSEIAAATVVAVSVEADEKALSSLVYVKQERVVRCLKMMRDLSDKISHGGAIKNPVPESPNGVLEAMCLSYKSDGSCTNSSYNSANNNSNKRRKQQ